jgi:hypothetical protein
LDDTEDVGDSVFDIEDSVEMSTNDVGSVADETSVV